MATIKSHTDIPQSKKLAEFLSLESADMKWFSWEKELNAPLVPTFGYDKETAEFYKDTKAIYLPCWSLAALLSVIPQVKLDSIKQYDKKYWRCCAYFASDWHNSDWRDNPVDACYEMVLKLHERKLL